MALLPAIRNFFTIRDLRSTLADESRSFGSTVAATGSGWNVGSYDDEWSQDRTKASDYLTTSPAVYMAARYRSQKLASVPLRFYRVGKGGSKTLVSSGSLVELMSKVNPYWTAKRLFEMTELSLSLYGKSFWALDRGQAGGREPKEIWWMHPEKVKVIRGGDYIKGFEYDSGSGQPLKFSPEEIFWLRYPNPADEYDGLSPLAAARIIADTSTAAYRSNARMFSQGMQLAGFVSPPSANDSWTKEQGAEIEGQLTRRFSGANKAHRWAVLGRQMTFQPLTVSPKDAEFISLLKLSFDDICRVFGLSPDLLGGERTYANAAEARLAFWQDTMIPECNFLADEATEQLLPMFAGQADIAEFDLTSIDVLQEREDAKWARESQQIAAGALTINAWLASKGQKPVAWGDDWWRPMGLVPTGGAYESMQDAADAEAASAAAQLVESQPPAVPPGQEPRALPSGRMIRALEYGSREHLRIIQVRDTRAAPHETAFGKMCAGLMRSQKRAVLASLNNQRGKRDVAEVADDPFDKAKWVKQFRTTSKPSYLNIVKDSGQAAADDLGIDMAFDLHDPNVIRAVQGRAQRFATEVNETTYTNLQSSLSEGVEAGESIDDLAKRVDQVMGDRIRSSAETIARTEVISAQNAGTQLSWEQSGVVGGKEWLCVAGDTRVLGRGVSFAARRTFSGPMATLETAHGRIVTVTADHRVLTRRGWIAAKDVHEGDDLVADTFVVESPIPNSGVMPNVNHVPPKIEETFDSLLNMSLDGGTVTRVVHLDREGRDSQIDVIPVDGYLSADLEPATSEGIREFVLETTDEFLPALVSSSATSASLVTHAAPGIGSAHGIDASLPNAGVLACESQLSGFGFRPNRLPSNTQALMDTGTGTSPFSGEREDRSASPIFLSYDRCVSVKIESAVRHVYDYTTKTGWMIANGLIIHNSALDDRTRETHVAAHGQQRALADDFNVGGGSGPQPGSIGLPEEDISCRCASIAILDIDWKGPSG